jgi:hypothetical protein
MVVIGWPAVTNTAPTPPPALRSPAYWLPDVAPFSARESPAFSSLLFAGPWQFHGHPAGGSLAVYAGAAATLDQYRAPVEVAPGLYYLEPLTLPHVHDLAREDKGDGVEVSLACGITLTIPVALITHRQFRVTGSDRIGDPISEYGRLASRLFDHARTHDGLQLDHPELPRLIALAVGQRYRVTPHLLDSLGIIAAEDVDPILCALWVGDPKPQAPASVGGASASQCSGSTGAR